MPADAYITNADMRKVANAIRAKGKTTEPLTFPDGMVQAISDIQAGGGGPEYLDPSTTLAWSSRVVEGDPFHSSTLYVSCKNIVFKNPSEIQSVYCTVSTVSYSGYYSTWLESDRNCKRVTGDSIELALGPFADGDTSTSVLAGVLAIYGTQSQAPQVVASPQFEFKDIWNGGLE